MKKFTAKIIDPIGIHARPAALVATTAAKFESTVTFKLVGTEKSANAKSVINLMSLGAKKDAQLEIVVDGPDADKAIEVIKQAMLDNKLIEVL